VIGLTTYLQQAQTGVWDVHASFLPDSYLQGVVGAGGIATLLPPQPVDADIAARVLDGIDGLIITGGRDVDPGVWTSRIPWWPSISMNCTNEGK
jgi:putative glutamine amidotransferase